MSRAAVDAVLRAASKGSRLTIVEIGHGEFARALLRSLTADEAAQGCIEEIVVCSSSCDVEALADGLPPVPMSAWKSPCRKVCPLDPSNRVAGIWVWAAASDARVRACGAVPAHAARCTPTRAAQGEARARDRVRRPPTARTRVALHPAAPLAPDEPPRACSRVASRGRRLGKGGVLPSCKKKKESRPQASADSPSSTPGQRQIKLLPR